MTCTVRISGRTGVGLTRFRALPSGLRFQDPHIKVRRKKVLSTGSSSNKSERITWCTAQLTHVHDTVCSVSFGKRVELKELRDSRLSQRNFPEGVSPLKHVIQVTATVRTVYHAGWASDVRRQLTGCRVLGEAGTLLYYVDFIHCSHSITHRLQ
jgi:hypothetical protein